MKICDVAECDAEAAFNTRTLPAFCDGHLTEYLSMGGVQPLEPVRSRKDQYMMRCLECGCEAHYRLETHESRLAEGSPTCDACKWRNWFLGLSSWIWEATVNEEQVKDHCETSGFNLLGPISDPLIGTFAYRTQCTRCERISVKRTGDIGWGCSCRANNQQTVRGIRGSGEKRTLFKDSGSPQVEQWDHSKNAESDWNTATTRATRQVNWLCTECGASFRRKINDIHYDSLCRSCKTAQEVERDAYWDDLRSKTVADFPTLVAAWADETDPRHVSMGDYESRRFVCSNGHYPRVSPTTFLHRGCQFCKGAETAKERSGSGETDMHPEMVAQWHPSRNGKLSITRVRQSSKRMIWWQCGTCGHEWEEQPRSRDKMPRLLCPACETILDSLAFHFPEIAAEWSPDNSLTAFQVRPTQKTRFDPEWICSNNGNHVWTAALPSRRSGSGCPECRVAGKSNIELTYLQAAKTVLGKTSSGKKIQVLRNDYKWSWLVDIHIEPNLVIEYDGAYWHRNKMATDRRKSLDLLEAGFQVVRLREDGLESLAIDHAAYTELAVYSTAPDPPGVMNAIQNWMAIGRTR